jgi:hypothetical protein
MPKYYFNTEDGVCLTDKDGTELADVESAKREAVQLICETLRNNAGAFWRTESFRVVVKDETDLTLFCLELSATLAPALGGGRDAFGH